MKILFLGETYRADAQSWIKGIEEASGCKIDTDEIKTIRFKPVRAIQAFLFIFRLLWGRYFGPKYDIVLAERSTSYGFFSLFTNAKVKVVAQQGISDIFPNTFFSRSYKKILQRLVYKKVDIIHAWGNAMVPAMLKSGANPEKIIVRPKGIDLIRFLFAQNKLDSNRSEISAIVTRSLLPEYNHWVIIYAIAELKKIGLILRVTIVGDGTLVHDLKNLSVKLGVSELIIFKGRIHNDDLPSLLSENELYISTPITEGASSSLMEAMAIGLFPIVTHLPGNMSFIKHEQNGLLVDVGSVESLVEAIINYYKLNSKKFVEVTTQNRNWIDENGNRKKNMQIFLAHYLTKIKF